MAGPRGQKLTLRSGHCGVSFAPKHGYPTVAEQLGDDLDHRGRRLHSRFGADSTTDALRPRGPLAAGRRIVGDQCPWRPVVRGSRDQRLPPGRCCRGLSRLSQRPYGVENRGHVVDRRSGPSAHASSAAGPAGQVQAYAQLRGLEQPGWYRCSVTKGRETERTGPSTTRNDSHNVVRGTVPGRGSECSATWTNRSLTISMYRVTVDGPRRTATAARWACMKSALVGRLAVTSVTVSGEVRQQPPVDPLYGPRPEDRWQVDRRRRG